MNPKLISIIVPVYNVEKYLENCIDSILKQTYTNFEVILIDDGSTDTSGEICDKYVEKDKRIQVIHSKNGGISKVRNKGIELAKGDYISFIDSDDIVSPKFLEILFTTINESQADISICGFESFYYNEPNLMQEQNIEKSYTYTKNTAMKALLEDEIITNHLWNKLYKRELWTGITFPDGKKFEDVSVMYKIFEKCQKIEYNPITLYYYRRRSDSILGNVNEEMLKDYIDVIQDRNIYLKEHYKTLEKEIECNKINCLLRYHLITVNEPELYNSNIMKVQYEELCKEIKNYPLYYKTKEIPLKLRALTYICCKNRKMFFYISNLLYKIKKEILKRKGTK